MIEVLASVAVQTPVCITVDEDMGPATLRLVEDEGLGVLEVEVDCFGTDKDVDKPVERLGDMVVVLLVLEDVVVVLLVLEDSSVGFCTASKQSEIESI
jgi:hypothetical protein